MLSHFLSTVVLSPLTGFRAQLYICRSRVGTGVPPHFGDFILANTFTVVLATAQWV